ncbi:MAG: hypothetical protein QOF92_4804 [Pseudonocardiales bacterium]|jgi:hypothetical protein|nr:hypothetical protein [Pseudonocardiales bacterium]
MRGSDVKIEMVPVGTGDVVLALVNADQHVPTVTKCAGVVTIRAQPVTKIS